MKADTMYEFYQKIVADFSADNALCGMHYIISISAKIKKKKLQRMLNDFNQGFEMAVNFKEGKELVQIILEGNYYKEVLYYVNGHIIQGVAFAR